MENKFHFTRPFLESFEETVKLMSEQLDKLNTLKSNMCGLYGIYNCSYKMRYITPSDVAEYISNLHKGVRNNLISTNAYDTEMFAVESAKRFIQNHGCVPFDAPSITGNSFAWKEHMTLQDLLLIHSNDVYCKEVCSAYEQEARYAEFSKGDLKIINDLHFVANMKKIVNQMPDMIMKMDGADVYAANPLVAKVFRALIEEFILFATTINMITVGNMCKYLIPTAVYKTVSPSNEKAEDKTAFNEYVTECCLLKTNNMYIEKKIPFNVNMRNVVLQDMTPDLRDTVDAVRFVLNDSRSPIHELLVQHATISRGEYGADMVKQAFLTHPHGWYQSEFDKTPYDKLNERTGFHSDPCWFDKIVYGNQYLDGNYRTDNPGNHHIHPITYDIDTIYKMFSCHHNDNEHLANNVVKVGNIMCGLIHDYARKQDVVWENLKDILVVFAEILTKSMLALYHNNNNPIVCSDDMNDTMVPGYMYCEQFYMEEDEPAKANADKVAKPTIQNKTEGMNQATKMQNLSMKIKQLLQRFMEYIRNTISQIFPKFNQNHKAEIDWIKNHKELNDEIGNALGSTFKIDINDYPHFNIPYKPLTDDAPKTATELKNEITNGTLADFYEKHKDLNALMLSLMYEQVRSKFTPENIAAEIKNNNVAKAVRNFTLYGNPDGIGDKTQTVTLTGEMWKNDIVKFLTEDFPKVIKDTTESNAKALNELTAAIQNAVKKQEDEKKKKEAEEKAKSNENNGAPKVEPAAEQTSVPDDYTQKLLEAVNDVNKQCYTASTSFLLKDAYGRTYNMYRDVVAEYQRQKKVGTENNTVTNEQKPENTEAAATNSGQPNANGRV